MVYITGDIHGDLSRFKSKELRRLKKNDYLIICGDFGFLWSGSKEEQRILKWLGKRRYHVLFVEGSHDNYNLLLSYPKTPWNGGEVRRISGRLAQLCRGNIFTIDGKTVFAFGGGESDDMAGRSAGGNWWKEELPEPWEIDEAKKNLERSGNQVDYIVTHQCSWRIKQFLGIGDNEANVLDIFFDELREKCSFKRWFFGSLHLDKLIPPGEVALFQCFVEMTGEPRLLGDKKSRKKQR